MRGSRLQRAVEVAGIGIWELDLRSSSLYFSDQALTLYGLTRERFDGTIDDWKSLVHPDDVERSVGIFEKAIRYSDRPFVNEFRIIHPTLGQRVISNIAHMEFDERGRREFLTGVSIDVTAERAATRSLTESAQYNGAVLDNVVDAILTFEVSGRILSFNRASEAMFGYRESEIVGRNVRMLIPENIAAYYDTFVAELLRNSSPRSPGHRQELELKRRTGDIFPVEFAISSIQQHGQTVLVGIVRDITESRRINQMKSEFISTVSHELRTPLTSIAGALGLVRAGALGAIPQKAQETLGISLRNCDRLTALINDLLDVEKIASGKMVFDFADHHLGDLLDVAIQANEGYLLRHRVRLDVPGAWPDVTVQVDEGRFQQVLDNFLSNAAKFSPTDGAVEIRVEIANRAARIIVTDSGPGIPERYHDRIFRRFSQVDASTSRLHGGTGLGLSICKGLATGMGGAVGFRSAENEGASFWVEFPCEEARQVANRSA
ncbi:sensor histidine kinase [Pelagovum pacificum]|uniref:histidine kinase n=1 Tax=Pelagovum pacificum TaxID=2588711 RepID=A0A5C5GBR0_9RHOB|nr:sensor histidine kinase [Pelagovum pacificum]QQA41202.1 PAS domain S-box protein [Pelagovum pacificum]TNY31990.1 PAS domain S-box protein [Pelagovum pacificum]